VPIYGPTSIAAADDDAWDENGGLATQCFCGDGGGTNLAAGWRFLNVTITNTATINSAIIRVRPRNLSGTITNVHGRFYGFAHDNAPVWNDSGGEPSAVARTSALIEFDPTVWTLDEDSATYEWTITAIVAEIIARGGWSSGNALSIVLVNDGSSSGNWVRMWDFGDGIQRRPRAAWPVVLT
jgi:hypothetical protein